MTTTPKPKPVSAVQKLAREIAMGAYDADLKVLFDAIFARNEEAADAQALRWRIDLSGVINGPPSRAWSLHLTADDLTVDDQCAIEEEFGTNWFEPPMPASSATTFRWYVIRFLTTRAGLSVDEATAAAGSLASDVVGKSYSLTIGPAHPKE